MTHGSQRCGPSRLTRTLSAWRGADALAGADVYVGRAPPTLCALERASNGSNLLQEPAAPPRGPALRRVWDSCYAMPKGLGRSDHDLSSATLRYSADQ